MRFLLTLIAALQFAVGNGQSLIKRAEALRTQISQLHEDSAKVNRLIQLARAELYIGWKDSAMLHSGQSALLSSSLNYWPGVLRSKLILIHAEIDMKKYS